MDAGIGPAGAVNTRALASHLTKSALNMILNRVAVRLALPARKLASVVGDDQLQPPRHPDFTLAGFQRASIFAANRDTPVESFGRRLDRHNRE